MSKTLISIVEIGAIIGLQFTGIGAPLGVALGLGSTAAAASEGLLIATVALAGAEALANSLLTKTPKPQITETAVKHEPADMWDGALGTDGGIISTGSRAARRSCDELFERARDGRPF